MIRIRRRLARWLDPGAEAALRKWQQLAEQALVEQDQMARHEKALRTLVWWLVQAQTGFGRKDARGIEDILDGASEDGGGTAEMLACESGMTPEPCQFCDAPEGHFSTCRYAPANLAERYREESQPVLGCCPHGVDLDREFCPNGCRV